jgi:hypothetical protein
LCEYLISPMYTMCLIQLIFYDLIP